MCVCVSVSGMNPIDPSRKYYGNTKLATIMIIYILRPLISWIAMVAFSGSNVTRGMGSSDSGKEFKDSL